MKKMVQTIIKVVLVQMVLTGILVGLAAFIMYKFNSGNNVYRVSVIAIYAIAAMVGGIILGKIKERKKYLWGILAGGIYIALILCVSLIATGSVDCSIAKIIPSVLAAIIGGMVGGMIS